jgi:hypothetical protein
MSTFLKWFIMFVAMIAASVIAKVFGVFDTILAVDSTHICSAIYLLFIFFTARCGYFLWNHKKHNPRTIDNVVDWGYVWANIFSGLGLIGTVIGLIAVMKSGFENIDVENQQTVKTAISNIGVGTGIALYTTLVGLICNILLKIQYGLLEKHYANVDETIATAPASKSVTDLLAEASSAQLDEDIRRGPAQPTMWSSTTTTTTTKPKKKKKKKKKKKPLRAGEVVEWGNQQWTIDALYGTYVDLVNGFDRVVGVELSKLKRKKDNKNGDQGTQ